MSGEGAKSAACYMSPFVLCHEGSLVLSLPWSLVANMLQLHKSRHCWVLYGPTTNGKVLLVQVDAYAVLEFGFLASKLLIALLEKQSPGLASEGLDQIKGGYPLMGFHATTTILCSICQRLEPVAATHFKSGISFSHGSRKGKCACVF